MDNGEEPRCTCGLEVAFIAVDNGGPDIPPVQSHDMDNAPTSRRYQVVDAECTHLGYFPSMEMAHIFVRALDALGDKAEAIVAAKRDRMSKEELQADETPDPTWSGSAWCLVHFPEEK